MKLVIGEKYRDEFEKSLENAGFDVIWMPSNTLFDERVAGHADLNLAYANGILFASKGLDDAFVKKLTNMGYNIRYTKQTEGKTYPTDAGLCVCDTGKLLLHNEKTADPELVAALYDRIPINIAQGYSRCAICVVDERSVITTDNGVAWTTRLRGLETLKVSKDTIELPGYDEGFIGGASVKLPDGRIMFFGKLDLHPDQSAIRDFIRRKGMEILELPRDRLMDVGSAVCLP